MTTYAHLVSRTVAKKRDPDRRAKIVAVLRALEANPKRQRGDLAEVARLYGVPYHYVNNLMSDIRRGLPAPQTAPAVFAVEVTDGSKLGKVSATYAAQASCPSACVFRDAGCYAEHGPLSMLTTKRLNRAAGTEATPESVAIEEAERIDQLTGTRDLRLHVVGDCSTEGAARIVAAAAARYTARGGGRVWTYTHAWRTVPREAWGTVSVLASCETIADIQAARARGYATSLTVQDHLTDKAHTLIDETVLPCPEQTRGVQCATCRLCTDDARLRDTGRTIAFALHGDRAGLSKARNTLAMRRREAYGR